jgi:hypothetical protein
LSYRAPNQIKFGHKGHLSIRNKFPKEVSSKSRDFPFNFRWTQKPRFWENEEKSVKSKRLEPWIHSKVGGRWWGSYYHPNPWKESKKNNSNHKVKNQAKNTYKILKMENIAAQQRRW